MQTGEKAGETEGPRGLVWCECYGGPTRDGSSLQIVCFGEIPPWHQTPTLAAASVLGITGEELMQAASHPATLHA